ncbi:MAG: hypothetical protein HKN08_06320 [Gammaproteobacteria bacterium]|nr:hypothetical protein [Gammaproteobacteria bacterium]
MSEITWILLTDGYYIKLLYYSGSDSTLKTYREDDFDNSSEITYTLITRYKNAPAGNQLQADAEDIEAPDYVLKLTSEFLNNKLEETAFNSLIIIAPDEVQDAIERNFSPDLMNCIKHKISGDHMNLPLDKLQIIIEQHC